MSSSQTQASSQGSWLRVAALMGCKPELAILRKFGKLNILRLLEMQSDLIEQEDKFEFICSLDAKEECSITQSYQNNWEELNESQGLGGSQQRDAWRKLRSGLEAYSKCTVNSALMQQIEISKQQGPSAHDMKLLREWLKSSDGNNSALRGYGWDAWEVQNRRDRNTEVDFLVLSSKHRQRDRFERWTGDKLLSIFHRLLGKRFKNTFVMDEELGVTEYRDAGISTAADIICTLLAPLLTTIPMFVLYFVKDIEKRLGIIMGFTMIFSISLAMFSSARRIEVFAATSAFAAVQVVYGAVN
ncbi:hypothetical protein JMJ35_008546 [Cladonia borealis]|uniref:DUF6594 domain-containing protein n=1 Tax=Cladonia borealis TaxID=184061 RepID=A0AA39V6Z8_9LECA|nr:hypothetical protein JMJ35_008546 [Cladonia borealis]